MLQGFNVENLVILFAAVFILYLAFKFLKGILKLIITVILIFTVGISLYNIFIVQKPLSYEIDRYKTDLAYFKSMSSINKEAFNALKEIKENKNIPENADKLKELEKRAEGLNHSRESSFIHNGYIVNFKKLTAAAEAYKTAGASKEYLEELSAMSDDINIKLKDILFPKEKH